MILLSAFSKLQMEDLSQQVKLNQTTEMFMVHPAMKIFGS